MNIVYRISLYIFFFVAGYPGVVAQQMNITAWVTDPAKSVLFQKQTRIPVIQHTNGSSSVITVDEKKHFQEMDGFGFALTGGSAGHLIKMTAASRAALLKELFDTASNNIGASYLRLSIGASDLNDHVFSYDDLPDGQTDVALSHFDLGPDRNDVIPVLKEILAINPAIKIMGSPWSAPVWMKTNNDTRGGSLKPEYYPAYAQYFVRYIQDMKKEGINIDAVTVQNEPLHPGNNPSMLMLAPDEAVFIKDHLGPAFMAAGIKTKIIIYDHNADRPDYPISVMNDAAAKQYIAGSAFHLYGGTIDALSEVHNAHPDKNLYFTEQWVGAPGNFRKDIADHVRDLIIGSTLNWSRTVIEWNLSSDPALNPHTDRGGCDQCLGAVTIDKDQVKRNPAYYIIAHAAKLVRPGSVRIASAKCPDIPNVAFRTPAGKIVLIALNDGKRARTIIVSAAGHRFTTTLNPGAIGTYSW